MATGDLKKIGTFYLGGTKQARPTRPWRTDTTPPGASSAGNIATFSSGQNIEIRNTEADDSYKLQWIEVVENDKKYLVADRNLLVNVSWDDLNSQDLINGKEITIDGQKYLLRVLTGGNNYRNGSDNYSGGVLPNEWDRWVVNEGGFSGLLTPTATDLDTSQTAADFNGLHNQKWNWFYIYSWGKEVWSQNGAGRVIRGYISARSWNAPTSSTRNAGYGWRPVLEVLNSGPVISGPAESLGNKTGPFSIVYSVTEPENENFTVVEKLNGTQIGSATAKGALNNREIILDLSTWATLALNTPHKIAVEATDVNGNKTVKEWTFTKTNAAPTAVIVEPKGDLSNIAVVDTLTPVLVHRFNDADLADVQSAYQYIIEDTNGAVIKDTGKISSSQSFYTAPGGVLVWGTRYKFKVRVWDKYDVASEYAAYQFFLPNRPPKITNLSPGSSDINSPAASGTAPLITWDFEDLDLEAQNSYQLKIFKSVDGSLVYNSNRIYQNVQQHQVPMGALEQGTVYYLELTAWDPNALSVTTPKAFIVTNATPSAPTPTLPVDNYRTSSRPTFSAVIGKDAENDKQHFTIQLATDAQFTENVTTFSSLVDRAGWRIGGLDIPIDGVNNSSEGQTVTFTPQVDLAKNTTYYWRIAAVDATTRARGVWSASRRIRCGNKLLFEVRNPINTGNTAARRILVALDYSLAKDGINKATLKVEVSNNALDVKPKWEDATNKFMTMDYYEFTNAAKTATDYAVSIRVTVEANDALGIIYVDALGMTFD